MVRARAEIDCAVSMNYWIYGTVPCKKLKLHYFVLFVY